MKNTNRTNPQQRAAMAKVVLLEELSNIERFFSTSAYEDLWKMIVPMGDPIKSSSQVDEGIKQIHFKDRFTVTFFAWGGTSAESVFKYEDKFKEDYVSPDAASSYLEGTNMHAFYAQCLEFQTKHKHTSIFGKKANGLVPFPETGDRWICLSYIGRMYNVCITKKS